MTGPGSVRDLAVAAASALVLGAVSTAADWIWHHHLEDGALLPALGHGVLFFAVLALVLAAPCPEPRRAGPYLLLRLPAAGLLLAGVFYPIAVAIGYLPALLVTWVAMWLTLALLHRPVHGRDESHATAILRGLAAATASGLAFWAVSGMWTRPHPGGPDLLGHLWRWTVAFLPGLVALWVRGPGESGRAPAEREDPEAGTTPPDAIP